MIFWQYNSLQNIILYYMCFTCDMHEFLNQQTWIIVYRKINNVCHKTVVLKLAFQWKPQSDTSQAKIRFKLVKNKKNDDISLNNI